MKLYAWYDTTDIANPRWRIERRPPTVPAIKQILLIYTEEAAFADWVTLTPVDIGD